MPSVLHNTSTGGPGGEDSRMDTVRQTIATAALMLALALMPCPAVQAAEPDASVRAVVEQVDAGDFAGAEATID